MKRSARHFVTPFRHSRKPARAGIACKHWRRKHGDVGTRRVDSFGGACQLFFLQPHPTIEAPRNTSYIK